MSEGQRDRGDLGRRLRLRREAAGISLRELARRIDVSASLISQVETGKVQPSVSTLYDLVSELGGSIDELFFGARPPPGAAESIDDRRDEPAVLTGLTEAVLAHPPIPPVQRVDDRKHVQFRTGVRWERLTSRSVPGVDFLHVTYEPGAESCPSDEYQRHSGREWGYVISGALHVDVGFDTFVLEPGDAISYASTTPHRLANDGDIPVEAIWFQFG